MKLAIDHNSSDAGHVVLIGDDGKNYEAGDALPDGERAFVWVTRHVSSDDPLRDRFLRSFLEDLLATVFPLPAEANAGDEGEDASGK